MGVASSVRRRGDEAEHAINIHIWNLAVWFAQKSGARNLFITIALLSGMTPEDFSKHINATIPELDDGPGSLTNIFFIYNLYC